MISAAAYILKVPPDRREILLDPDQSPYYRRQTIVGEPVRKFEPQHLRWSEWATDEEGITGDALLDFVNNSLLPKLKNLVGTGDKLSSLIRAARGRTRIR